MMDMGHGADNHDITILLCSALPKEIMQTLEIPSILKTRATDDYLINPVRKYFLLPKY